MSDWQPIETAPTGVTVRLGRWDVFDGHLRWREREGVAFKRVFWLWRARADDWMNATHWMPLPAPPE